MTHHRRIIVSRPEVARRDFSKKKLSTSLPTTIQPPLAHTHAHDREHTTTTNVVSVVCDARVREHERTHAREQQKSPNSEQLLEQILLLEPSAQKQLMDQVAARQMLTTTTATDRDISMWSVAVADAYSLAVGGAGSASHGPLLFRKVLGGSAAWAPVAAFMSSTAMQNLEVTDRQAVYMLLADMLVGHTKSLAKFTGAPFAPKLLANCTANIAGLFDNAFPGYLEAGLVKIVARQMRARGKAEAV